ncbi:MAG TPA: hypothetical protein VFE12_10255 [Acetobacteraceae bacterium]|jgi:hypothetical protein|nr:hypothetical protein [Acetobacteraceae bacterium]
MRYSLLLPLGLLALTGCVVETPVPARTSTTYVTPAPAATYVTPAYPAATYAAPPTTTVIRTP